MNTLHHNSIEFEYPEKGVEQLCSSLHYSKHDVGEIFNKLF